MGVVLLGFSLFFGLLFNVSAKNQQKARETELEQNAQYIQQSLTTLGNVTRQNFDELLAKRGEVLWKTINQMNRSTGLSLLLVNASGKIVMTTDSTLWDLSLSSEIWEEGVLSARSGTSFSSDLGGLLPEEHLTRVVLLEQQGTQGPVGCVYLVQPNGTSLFADPLFQILILPALLLCAVVLIAFFVLSRPLIRPLRQLNDAALAFAAGDFSGRLPEEKSGEMTPLIRAYNQMAEQMEERESIQQTFLSNISHDLRTPLTTIGGFIQNMKEGAIPPEKQNHYFQIILGEVDRLSRLVQTLLDSAKLSAGERKYQMAPMDLCELACVTLLSFEKRLEEKKVNVTFDCQRDYIYVQADQDAIQQVIYNLTDNAAKFTPDGGELSVTVKLHGKKAIFSIRNSGEGIPKEELSHLFDRFYKSDRSRGMDKRGMGLGLFIVKSIINAHKEEIWVESLPGSYTEFTFTLPLAKEGKGGKNRT